MKHFNEIQQNRGGTTINIGPFNLTLIDLGGIGGVTVTGIALGGLYFWHRSKKQKKKPETTEKDKTPEQGTQTAIQ